jgi:hypothetical protein
MPLTAELITPSFLVITSRHGQHRKHRSSVVIFMPLAMEACVGMSYIYMDTNCVFAAWQRHMWKVPTRVYQVVAQKRPRRGPEETPFFNYCMHVCCRCYLAMTVLYRVTTLQWVCMPHYAK